MDKPTLCSRIMLLSDASAMLGAVGLLGSAYSVDRIMTFGHEPRYVLFGAASALMVVLSIIMREMLDRLVNTLAKDRNLSHGADTEEGVASCQKTPQPQ